MDLLNEVDLAGLKVTVVKTAMELDIFTVIARGDATVEAIAAATTCSARGIRILLNALCALGLVVRGERSERGEEHHLTPTAEAYLVRDQPGYFAPILLDWLHNRDRFTECVRTGLASVDPTQADAEEAWVAYAAPARLQWPELVQARRERYERFDITTAGVTNPRILDIACGSAIRSFVFALDDPTARVTALDRPHVLQVTRDIADTMGLADRVEYLAGAVQTVELPAETFDVVVCGSFLHYFEPAQLDVLLRRVRSAMRPHGLLVILENIPDEERTTSQVNWSVAVEMFCASATAQLYTFVEWRSMLERAGFTAITYHDEQTLTARNGERLS
jgi:SAM-dependent methyltransferase